MKPVGVSDKLGRMLLWLMAVIYPLAIGIAIYLSVGRGWPWYESVLVSLGILWIASGIWIAWRAVTSTG